MKLQQHLRATLIVTGLGLLAGACAKNQADGGHHEEEPQTVVLTTPSVMSVPTTQAYVCRMQSRRHIEIRALNEGYLEEIPVQEGQAVRAGERLYELYPVLYRTQLEAEKAELRLAEINLQNTEQLAGRGFVSAPELARATAERDRAKAKRRPRHGRSWIYEHRRSVRRHRGSSTHAAGKPDRSGGHPHDHV